MSIHHKQSYLIHFQYLGFRLHGWQKQPNVKTIQGIIEKTLCFILGEVKFRTLAAGRTDSMVSANKSAFQLVIHQEVECDWLLDEFKNNLPADIKVLQIEKAPKKFNIIQAAEFKEYHYYFTNNEAAHPFCASLLTSILQPLDLETMQKAAKLFEGEHDFTNFCTKPREHAVFQRTIISASIIENDIITANFFPKTSYVFKVKGKGFMRNQVRLMMGALIRVGLGEVSLAQLQDSLKPENPAVSFVAPASGLVLHDLKIG